MCDKQSLRSACAYPQSDQSFCLSLEYSITVKLLIEHHLEFICLKGAAQTHLILHLSNCPIVGNQRWLIYRRSRRLTIKIPPMRCNQNKKVSLVHCSQFGALFLIWFCIWSLFCNAVLSVLYSFAITLLRKRKLVALLCSCCRMAVSVMCLFAIAPAGL